MTFEIELGGRSRTVSIERAGANRYRVAVDGHPHLVDAVKVGEFSLSLIVDGETGSSRELLVVPTSGTGELLVTLDGLTATVSVDGRRTRRPGADAGHPCPAASCACSSVRVTRSPSASRSSSSKQ
jgi:hypothetical protein